MERTAMGYGCSELYRAVDYDDDYYYYYTILVEWSGWYLFPLRICMCAILMYIKISLTIVMNSNSIYW